MQRKTKMDSVSLQFQGNFQDGKNIRVSKTAQFVQTIKLIELSMQEAHEVTRFWVQTHPANV